MQLVAILPEEGRREAGGSKAKADGGSSWAKGEGGPATEEEGTTARDMAHKTRGNGR